MPRTTAKAPAPSSRGRAFDHDSCHARRRVHLPAVLASLALAAIVLASPVVRAATFAVSQEQVAVGTTDGTAGVLAEDGLRETMREVDVAPDPLSYPGAENLSKGSQVAGAFPAAVRSSDGVYVQYREGTIAPVTAQSNPTAAEPGCTWTACGNGSLSDNNYASSASGGDLGVFGNFSFNIPTGVVITSVQVGTEAFDATGNDRLSISISWDRGVSWCPATTVGLPGSDPNVYAFVGFTSCVGHSWISADFNGNISTRFTHAAQGPPEPIDLDANVVRVTYQPLAYELALEYDWTGFPQGQRYDFRIKGHVGDENVSVQVLTPPSTWTTRLTLASTMDQIVTYTLNVPEFNAGNVSIRFVDSLGPDVVPSDLWIDYVDVLTAIYAYHLDVVQTVTGIVGDGPTLVLKGNISAGGENFAVFVWNFTAGAWDLAIGSAFTPINEAHAVILSPEAVGNGTVRINYRDVDPASLAPATLTLDLVQVTAKNPASGFSSIVLVGGGVIAGAAAFALFLFFVVLPRRKASSGDSPTSRAERLSSLTGRKAKDETPSPAPEIAIGDLRPGGAYLVDGSGPDAGLRALERLTRMGRSGMLITRRNPLDVQRGVHLRHTKIVWVADTPDSGGGPIFAASLPAISSAVGEFLQTNPVGVLLIDCMMDLVDGNDFPSVLQFIRQTAEKVAPGQQIFLVSTSPGVLRGRELKLLAQDLDVVRIK